MVEEIELGLPPTSPEMLTALDLAHGAPIAPLTRLSTMDSVTWEEFTLELVTYWKTQFKKVTRCGGGGDMGRDVIALSDESWENFQCKHYAKPLSVAEAILEVGKLIYYSYIKEYTYPSKYYFVCPRGSSNDLTKVLSDPTGKKMKDELLARWDKSCKDSITSKTSIPLEGELRNYVHNTVDFTIFDDIPPLTLIKLHNNTPYHVFRFGSYHRKRPEPPKAPTNIDWTTEQVYVQALLDAFSEYRGTEITAATLPEFAMLSKEMSSARNNYYSADALDRFSRDWLPVNCFQDLKEQCYEAISPTILMRHLNAFEKYLKTSDSALKAPYDSHPLNFYMKPQDKKGLCHHLVNNGTFKWTDDEEK